MTYPPNEQVNVNSAGEPVVYTRTSPMAPIIRTVWLLFGVLIALIGIRILFLALGANEGNVIVDTIYAITDPFVAPFRGIFSIDQVQPTRPERVRCRRAVGDHRLDPGGPADHRDPEDPGSQRCLAVGETARGRESGLFSCPANRDS